MTAQTLPSVCPHDCPSACALSVEVFDGSRIGRVHGAAMPYEDGVICAKVARYAERVHHPDRVLKPLRRVGAKGEGRFEPMSWDEALDEIADRFQDATIKYGAEAVWPYHYAGTMGLVQQNGINRLRRLMGYSDQARTICSSAAGAGWAAGVGAKWGVDPREIPDSDLVVVWGANPVATQVQLMGLIQRARKERGARLVVVDPYRTPTAEKADMHLMLRPGTDGALACAVMHVLLRDGLADRDFLRQRTDFTARVEAHLITRSPNWAAGITGLTVAEIEAFARLYGETRRSFLRVGYGFARSRNGAVNLHAVSCLPAVTGAWQHKGGGAVQSMSGVFRLDRRLLNGTDTEAPKARLLDMSRIGAVLTGDVRDLGDGPPVKAVLMQNTNPATVAPDSGLVRRGLARPDLFLAVHEQFLTKTAAYADIVLPATTSMEHADLYSSYGHTFLQAAKPVIAPLGEARSNHWVVGELARRLNCEHPAFAMSEWQLMDATLAASGLPGADDLHAMGWLDCALPFEKAHFTEGFGHGRFRFFPRWAELGDDHAALPDLPDHLATIDEADAGHPFRLVTPPSRHFLNSSFTETPTSRQQAVRPTVLLHPDDAAGIADGALVRLGNAKGSLLVHAKLTDGIARGVVAVESVWPDDAFVEGVGINLLTSAEPAMPAGGAVFHDTKIWMRTE